jgi:hypothetical protein
VQSGQHDRERRAQSAADGEDPVVRRSTAVETIAYLEHSSVLGAEWRSPQE